MQEETLEFNFTAYLDTLMQDLEMAEMPEETQKSVRQELAKQLGYRIMSTLSMNLKDEAWEEMEELAEVSEFATFAHNLINKYPNTKEAIVDALEIFYQEQVAAYQKFKA